MAEQILKTEFSEIMQKSYIDYAMSVICQRALPDIRDGLKPVQRRVLYAMNELHLDYDKPHRKSARIVGDTMGKYHPHGDSSIYDALVVLSQDFKKGMSLIDGHGNFGSIEGDGAAAMRYTEARLKKFSQVAYLADLDKNVVDFGPNFDETEKEPVVLPVKVPNILINGSEGIAVGMTTSIPTHNLLEVLDGVIAYMENEKISTKELMEHIKGPDFPTGGIVINKSELLDIYESGSGKIKLRGKVEFEPAKKKGDKDKLVITEIPYTMIGANIGKFMSDIVGLLESKKLTDVTDLTNESSKEGIRIVLELKKNADVEKIKNILYKKTKLEDTFGVNMLAILDGRPETLGLKKIIAENVKFQYEVNTRKYKYLLEKEFAQKEIKEGLIRACNIIDVIIEVLRGAQSVKDAKLCLVSGETKNITFKSKESEVMASQLDFTEVQAQAILDLRLSKLVGLEILALKKEYEEIIEKIARYEDVLENKKSMTKVIRKELESFKKEFGCERKTTIEDGEAAVVVEEKFVDMEVAFLMDRFGYSKTIDMGAFERNKETLVNETKHQFSCMTSDKVVIFTNTGVIHQVKVRNIPFVKPKDKGTPIDNLGNYDSSQEYIVGVFAYGNMEGKKVLFTTKQGMVKLVDAKEFDVNKKTANATKLADGDEVVSVNIIESEASSLNNEIFADESNFIPQNFDDEMGQMSFFDELDGGSIITSTPEAEENSEGEFVTHKHMVFRTNNSLFLKIPISEIPEKKKGAVGVRGLKLKTDDYVTGVYILDIGESLEIDISQKKYDLRNLKVKKRDNNPAKIS